MKVSMLLASASAMALVAFVAPPASAEDAARAAEEIVVTAQRRQERLVDVPLSVSAANQEQLRAMGVADIRDLPNVFPGLLISGPSAFVQPAIRGVSSTSPAIGNDANVAIYIDEIYQPSQRANNFALVPDLERVEVLRGPQGTLFGRNATGGAIKIFTRNPQFEWTGTIRVTEGEYFNHGHERGADLFVTGPISDKLAFSFTAQTNDTGGWIRDLVKNEWTGDGFSNLFRGKLLYKPTDRVSLLLNAHYTNSKDPTASILTPSFGNSLFAGTPGVIIASTPWTVANNTLSNNKTHTYGGSAIAEVDFDWMSVKSTSSYDFISNYNIGDIDMTTLNIARTEITNTEHTWTQELQFSSNDTGRLKWVGGLYYFNDNGRMFYPSAVRDVKVKTEAWAAFGEAAFDITDRLSVIGGLRYSSETKEYFGASFPVPIPLPLIDEESWHSLTPRASVKYELADDTNVYFTYSQGFKSGAYSSTALSPIPVNPEYVDAFEVGFKMTRPRYALNFAAYHYLYKDMQVSQFISASVGSIITNAASSSITGFDVDGWVRLSEHFRLSASFNYLPMAEFDSYPGAIVTVPNPGNRGYSNAVIDAAGLRLVRAPKFTFNVSPSYEQTFSWGTFGASLGVFHSDRAAVDQGNSLYAPSYTLVTGQLSWTSPSEQYKVTLWGRNLTNEEYFTNGATFSLGNLTSWSRPRIIGATLEYNF